MKKYSLELELLKKIVLGLSYRNYIGLGLFLLISLKYKFIKCLISYFIKFIRIEPFTLRLENIY